MAKLSRNQRHKARQRRTLSLLKREFRKLYTQHNNATFALLSAVKEAGGTITLSKATLAALMPVVQQCSWKSALQENGDVVIELVDNTPKGTPEGDSVTKRFVDDETVEQPQGDASAAGDPIEGEVEPTDAELLTEALEGDGA